ncbi:PLP-dependent aminotransferase family protein [Magnetovibrio sp. PR-2]|uniref:aminotransferase-like domain-containing protein n=1 Tax=Magnetovibrio sp. PR-2 TaxID=3120356 RepID=UPI002FCE31FA
MTIYSPSIEGRIGPKYRIIADAISDDIHANVLEAGTKLPTHRDLAYRLGVTVGTITRAYAELQRRGVAGGRVGSGTFVIDQSELRRVFPNPYETQSQIVHRNNDRIDHDYGDDTSIDLSMNRPSRGPEAKALAATLGELSQADGLDVLTQYNPAPGLAAHREAISKLVRQVGLDIAVENTVLTSGAQHAMSACALGLIKGGDVLLCEELTYPGMTSLAGHMGARLKPVAMDAEGIRPDAFEAAIVESGARVGYFMPVHQNPTTAVMSMERLHAIADIAKRHNFIIIEDDVYGFQPKDRNPPLAQLAPDNVIYITGFAKSLAPGLRVGFMLTPKALFAALTRAVQITGWMAPPLMGEIATRWVNSGIAQEIIGWHQDEMLARNAIAYEVFKGYDFAHQPTGLHMWLNLPEDHYADEVIRILGQRGIIMAGPESFITTQPTPPRALRLCLGSATSREKLTSALKQVRDVLSNTPQSAQPLTQTMVM